MAAHVIVFGTGGARKKWRAAHAFARVSTENADRIVFTDGASLDLFVVSAPIDLYRLRGGRWDSYEIHPSAAAAAPGTGFAAELDRLLAERCRD